MRLFKRGAASRPRPPKLAAALLLAGCASMAGCAPRPQAPAGTTAAHYPPDPSPSRAAAAQADGEFVSVLAKEGEDVKEATVVVSPADPKVVVAGGIRRFADRPNESRCVVYRSQDGGVTWSAAQFIPLPDSGMAYLSSGDPVLGADRAGVFYYAILMARWVTTGGGRRLVRSGVAVSRSTDNGGTWEPARPLIEREQPPTAPWPFDDKEWLVVDNSGGTRDGTVYVGWQMMDNIFGGASQLVVSKSTDRGLTWSEPRPADDKRLTGSVFLAVGPGGELVMSSTDAGFYRVRVSTDGGETWGPPLRGPEMQLPGGTLPNTSYGIRVMQAMAFDHSRTPHRGRLYFAYPGSTPQNPGGFPAAVMFRYSADMGRTWSQPLRLGGDPALRRDAILPSIVADAHTGDVVVAWLDRRDDPNNAVARLYAARSRDGGQTFEPARAYSGPLSLNSAWLGDYNHAGSAYGRAVAAFSDAAGALSVARLSFCAEAGGCGGARGGGRRRW